MNQEVILNQLILILKREFDIQVSEQHLDQTFLELGIDSINFMMLCVLAEEALSCVIQDNIMIEKSYNRLTLLDFVSSIQMSYEQ